MRDFRTALTPMTTQPAPGVFRAALALDGRPVWWSGNVYSMSRHGLAAKEMALDDARCALLCDDGSQTAEHLAEIVGDSDFKFNVGDRVRLRRDADLDGADMEHLPSMAIGTIVQIGWMDADDMMVDFDCDEKTTHQCDPAWLEPTAPCETNPALQDPFTTCPACGALPGDECMGGRAD